MWPYTTAGIPDDAFERMPGIPLSPKEVRVLIISQLRLRADSCLWDVGAGTGTIAIEAAFACAQVIAIERDPEVAELTRRNCTRFERANVSVVEGTAPLIFAQLADRPDRVLLEGGNPLDETLKQCWQMLKPEGRLVAIAGSLEALFTLSAGLSAVQARQIEVVQAAVNRLELKGRSQRLVPLDPMFILSGVKVD